MKSQQNRVEWVTRAALNLGSILLFAIVGTTISALVVGGGVYLMGLAGLVYQLNFEESFAFGSLISAVDPVATLAIFQVRSTETLFVARQSFFLKKVLQFSFSKNSKFKKIKISTHIVKLFRRV